MSEQTTQTVTETNPPAQPGGAAPADARTNGDDLDSLLASYDGQQTEKPTPPAKPETTGDGTPDLKALTEQVQGLLSETQRQTFQRDMAETVKAVRGNLDAEIFDDQIVEAWMDAQARNDPRLNQAWLDRHKNPKQFQKVVEGLGRAFEKKYGKALVDKGATEDRAAVASAVRGASTQAPEGKAPNFSAMSDREFEAEKAKYMG